MKTKWLALLSGSGGSFLLLLQLSAPFVCAGQTASGRRKEEASAVRLQLSHRATLAGREQLGPASPLLCKSGAPNAARPAAQTPTRSRRPTRQTFPRLASPRRAQSAGRATNRNRRASSGGVNAPQLRGRTMGIYLSNWVGLEAKRKVFNLLLGIVLPCSLVGLARWPCSRHASRVGQLNG